MRVFFDFDEHFESHFGLGKSGRVAVRTRYHIWAPLLVLMPSLDKFRIDAAFISEELLREGKRQLTKRKAILVRPCQLHAVISFFFKR